MGITTHFKQVHEKEMKSVLHITGAGNIRRRLALHLRHAPVLVMLHHDEILQALIAIGS